MYLNSKGWLAVLLLSLTSSLSFASLDHETNHTNISTEIVARYLRLPWMDGLQWLTHPTDSPDRKEVRALFRGVQSSETWALQLLDSMLKDQSNNQETDIQDLKTKDSCPSTNSNTKIGIRDEHCMVQSMQVGFKDFTRAEICTIILFLIITVVLLGCTICDFMARNRPGKSSATVNTLARFSLYTNALTLFRPRSSAQEMHAIHGIKCFSTFSVLFGHRYLAIAFMLNRKIRLLDVLQRNTLFGMYLSMTPITVDTFSVVSGFLVAYTFLRMKQSGKECNVLTTYLYRYLRLTPCTVVMLLFICIFFHRCGSGPIWEFIITYVIRPCQENWWANLLYVQNLIGTERICMGYSWYLAADMQLLLLSPLILYPLHTSPKFGLRLLIFLLVVALVTPVIILAVNDYSIAMLRFDKNLLELSENFGNFYISTYKRVLPYLIGILLGYDIATKKRRLTQVDVAINWSIAVSLVLFSVWLNNQAYNSAFADDWNVRIWSAALSSPSWSIGIAWLIYACTQGYGGLASRFLSLPIFVLLSRLSYCIYLVHMGIQAISIASSESSITVSNYDSFYDVCSDLVMSIAVAFVFHLFIESPTMILTKILLADRKAQPASAPRIKELKNS